MKAYVLIKIRTGEVKRVVQEMRRIESVKNVDMTFGPYDAIAVVENSDIGQLGQLLALVIQPIDGVEQTLTCLAVDV